MAYITLTLVCFQLLLHVSTGNNSGRNERNFRIFLEQLHIEKHFKIAKRSSNNDNEIGGSNDNGIILTTTESNFIQYSVPDPNVSHEVNVKFITTTPTLGEAEKQIVPDSDASDPDMTGQIQPTDNQVGSNHTAGSLTNERNGNNTTETSDGTTVNSTRHSTTTSADNIHTSNETSFILNKQHVFTSQNESKNHSADNFMTPVTSTQENAQNLGTESQNFTSDKHILNTTQVNYSNGASNDIPRVTTQPNVFNTSLNLENSGATVLTKTEVSRATTVPSVIEDPIESQSNNSHQSPSLGSQSGNISDGENIVAGTTKSSNKPFSESTESVTGHPNISPAATTANLSEVESFTREEISTIQNFENNTSNIGQAEPIPEPESDNTTVASVVTAKPTLSHTSRFEEANRTTVSSVKSSTYHNSVQVTKSQDRSTNINASNGNVGNATQRLVTESGAFDTSTESIASYNSTHEIEQNYITTKSTVFVNNRTEQVFHQQTSKTLSKEQTTVSTRQTTMSVEQEDNGTAEAEKNISVATSYPASNTKNSSDLNTTTIFPTTSNNNESLVASVFPSTTSKNTLSPETSSDDPVTATEGKGSDKPKPEYSSPTTVSQINNSTNSTTYPIDEVDDKTDSGDETDAEPEPENVDPEPENEGESEPDSEKDHFNTENFAEPGPDWEVAKVVWKEAWTFHIYFFGISFALLGLYSLLTLVRLWNMEHMVSKHYFITLQLLVTLVCVLRTTYLMIDAYNSMGTFPFGVDYFLYSTAFPCLTALFSILFYALLLATRVQAISKKVQKLWVLVLIISLHFVLSITTDIVVGLLSSASILIFICQSFFILWGLLMFIGYLVIFRKLYKGAINRKKAMLDHKGNVNHLPSKQRYTLGLAVKVTFISAFFGVAITAFELYGMFGVYGVLQSNRKPEPWPWWTYHTIVRTLEIFMCITVAYVASQPLRYRLKKHVDRRLYHYLVPCSLCCCPDKLDQNETYSSSLSLDYVVSETDHFNLFKKLRRKKQTTSEAPYPPHTAEKYSDPDATLLVRKVKRNSKPSMLVVEDGFVRIKRDDEILPPNQYDIDSGSSHSSETNFGPGSQRTRAVTNKTDLETSHVLPSACKSQNMTGINFDNYILQGNVAGQYYSNSEETADDTDIDIVVTESELEDNQEPTEVEESGVSNKSVDIFRPLSMIDLATSMESELDRAFNSSCVEEADLISNNSLPITCDGCNNDWDESAYNEFLCDKYPNNKEEDTASYQGSTNYSSDSTEDQSKSSVTRLLRPPVRRCKSDDSKSSTPKFKHFEKNRYFSVSDVDSIGKDDEMNTHLGSNGELQTEL